jgi:hypothetical protein
MHLVAQLPNPGRSPQSRGAGGVGDVAGERGDRAAFQLALRGPEVREATIWELGHAAEGIQDQAILITPEVAGGLERFDAMRAIMDARPADRNTAAHLDGVHRPALFDAMREHITSRARARDTAQEEGHAAVALKYAATVTELAEFTAALADDDREGA